MQPTLTLTDAPDPALPEIIRDGLDRFNDAITGASDRRSLAVELRDPATGDLIGGLSGRTSLGLLFIDLVFVPESVRGQDVGTRMLALAEAEARRRGCRAAMLYTISFQAPGFYMKRGYRVFGEIACDPPGTARVFLTKDLA
jgi:GNAT superfamily N-acetyltransferase